MAIMMARNCSPTRQRMSFWLRLGLEPRIMFQNPASRTRNTATTASVVAYCRTVGIAFAPFLSRVTIGGLGGGQWGAANAHRGGARAPPAPRARPAGGFRQHPDGPGARQRIHATIGVNFCRELRHITRSRAIRGP